MKKFLALILALIMVFSLSSVAFAANVTIEGNNPTNPVTVTVGTGVAATIYQVEITWQTLTFEYDLSKAEWNPGTHKYEDGDADSTGWKADTIENAIVVKNHSNGAVDVDASFGNGTNQATNFSVTATVATTDNETLDSADTGVYLNDRSQADSVSYTVSVSGAPDSTYDATTANVVGTITVTISPVGNN